MGNGHEVDGTNGARLDAGSPNHSDSGGRESTGHAPGSNGPSNRGGVLAGSGTLNEFVHAENTPPELRELRQEVLSEAI